MSAPSTQDHSNPNAPADAAEAWSWRDALSKEEVASLLEPRDWKSWMSIAFDWGVIAASFALVAVWPNILTIAVALVLIGTRQLGLAVMMHEAAHRTLFADRKVNDWVGNWLCAYPVWADVHPYRAYHLVHHAHTGRSGDPDLSLVAPFPITRKSFARKLWRDLSGQTGWKQAVGTAKRDLGLSRRATQRTRAAKAGEKPDVGWHKLVPVLITNGIILGALTLAGHPALYLLWVVAFLTTYRVVLRIRSIAEHALATDTTHPLKNTRTTLLSWWERLLIGPNRVNYHLEHHLLMTVPHYNLPRLHEILRRRGALDDALVSHGYREVLMAACARPEEAEAQAA